MVEGMSVVVNVMLSLMSVMSPPPALCNLSLRTVVKLCTLGVLTLGVSLVSCIVMMSGGVVVAVSAYIGGTHGSGVLSSACDVLEMIGVGGMSDMCRWNV